MTTLTVTGMSCAHCVQAVTKALQAQAGVTSVQIDLATGIVVVAGTAAPEALRRAIEEAGYAVPSLAA